MKKWNFFWLVILLIFISGTLMAVQYSEEIYLEKLKYKTEHEFYTDNNLSDVNNNENLRNYCDSFWNDEEDDWITNVTFNTINNTTGQDGGLPSYGDYTAISTNVNAGDTYTFSMSWFSEGRWTEYGAVWFDWNQDEDFFDAGEYYEVGSGVSTTVTIDITIPPDAASGATRMRVSERFNTYPEPCNESNATWGETEDYTVVIGGGTTPGTIEGTVYLDGGTGNVEDVEVEAGSVIVNPATDGTYSIELYAGTYDVTASLAGYEDDIVIDVVVTEGSATTGVDFTLTFIPPNPIENLLVDEFTGLLSWEEPISTLTEFRYDDGVITGQLGFNSSPNAVMGASHPNNAIIEEVTWLLTSNAAHSEAFIYIFGLDGAGLPDTGQLLHQSAALPNIDDAWNTYTLPTSIEAPNGFLVGVNTPNFIALGTDDGVGDPWAFQLGTQWGIPDRTVGNDWLDVGPQGYSYNFSIRAYGSDLGEIALAEIDDSNVNYTNSGLFGSKLNISLDLNGSNEVRDLTGYNVYLDDVLQGNTTDLEYLLENLVNGVEYTAGVEAVYDEGESDVIEITFTYTGASEVGNVITASTKLNSNYPNPFNPVTTIAYSIKDAGNITLEVYNLRGQLVKTLVNDIKETGDYTAIWDGTDDSNKSVSSGVYFYKMVSEGNIGRYTSTKKMILMK